MYSGLHKILSFKNFNRIDTKPLQSIIFSEIDHIMYLSMLTAKFIESIEFIVCIYIYIYIYIYIDR